jgi:two-component system, OmpR family, sensor histidine kinase VicK
MPMDSKSHANGCALCGTRLVGHSNPFEEKIGEKSYRFDTKDCAIMFKRFLAIYGDDFRLLSGNTAFIIPKEQEIKLGRKQEKQRRDNRPREKRLESVGIIKDPTQTQELFNELINSAREKIEILFSSINLFYYYNRHKKNSEEGFQLLERVAAKKGLNVKIITPSDKNIKEISSKINAKKLSDVQIRCIEGTRFLDNKIMLLVVDGKQSLALQLKEKEEEYKDGALTPGYNVTNGHQDTSEEMIGLGTYSKNIPTVLSYATIFETLWKELELNGQISNLLEKLKSQQSLKTDFLSIAAHELRDPIQPVLGLAEVLQSRKGINIQEQEELLAIIIRNAKRLKALTENILDLTRIESQSSLTVHKEIVDIQEVIRDEVSDIKSQLAKEHNVTINVEGKVTGTGSTLDEVLVEADRLRLMQVVSNLLTNAIKFTEHGTVSIRIEMRIDNNGSNHAVVSIRDNGQGIDPSIMSRLFEKFATKCDKSTGLGLGLFISKNIIESYGGKIWAENNPEGKGATFTFSLPLARKHSLS